MTCGDGCGAWRLVDDDFQTHRASVTAIDFDADPVQRPGRSLRHNSGATQSQRGSGRRWVISALGEFQKTDILQHIGYSECIQNNVFCTICQSS